METFNINGHVLEYYDDTHTYYCDGEELPSVTQFISQTTDDCYKFVDKNTLERASVLGTELHQKIENYEKHGIDDDSQELYNYKFLKKAFKFECLDNELPIIVFDDDNKPILCGRLDMIIKTQDGKKAVADIKRMATLQKNKVALQLNLYRLGYMQSYGDNIESLHVIKLRNNDRKFYTMPVNEDYTKDKLREWSKHND